MDMAKLMKEAEEHHKFLTAYKQALLDAGGNDIPETYTRYLRSGISESNKIRFMIVAFELPDMRGKTRNQQFQRYLKHMREDIQRDMKRDSPDVMNEVGILSAVEKNKKVVFAIADNLGPILKKARRLLMERGYVKGVKWRSSRELFAEFIPGTE